MYSVEARDMEVYRNSYLFYLVSVIGLQYFFYVNSLVNILNGLDIQYHYMNERWNIVYVRAL